MKKIITLLSFCLVAGMVTMNAQSLKVIANGNVGINQGTPSTRLHVVGEVTVEPESGTAAGLRGPSADGRFQISNSTGNEASASYLSMNGASTNGNLVYSASFHNWKVNKVPGAGFGDDAMRLYADGRLKMGSVTTAPTNQLDITLNASKPGGGDWLASSDKRLKKNISQFSLGLDEILKINPVSFQYNGKGGIINTEKVYTGVIAQEYQKIEPSAVEEKSFRTYEEVSSKDENGAEKVSSRLKSDETYFMVDASSIKYMLVNAIKEQQKMIDDLATQNEELVAQIAEIRKSLSFDDNGTIISDELNNVSGFIGQNQPNPFNEETTIEYFIPQNAKSASIEVFDLNGQLVKSININQVGKGIVNLKAANVPTGSYVYSFVIDGQKLDTKKMIIAK